MTKEKETASGAILSPVLLVVMILIVWAFYYGVMNFNIDSETEISSMPPGE